jgi:hypothetical protein
MSAILTPRKTTEGWVIDLPDEMAQAIGVATGSIVVLHASEEGLRTEILPPLTQEMQDISQHLLNKNRDLYTELKRLGDGEDSLHFLP